MAFTREVGPTPLGQTIRHELPQAMTRFSLCTVGFRGVVTVEALIAAGVIPTRLVSYPQRGDPSGAFEQIKSIGDRHGIPFERTTAPAFADGEWAMLVGWQYRVAPVTDHLIVFHDSLLPRYRGFAPTATALINGDREIGVTAIRPVEAVDAGPILGQRRWMVEYPIRARAALERQAKATADLAGDLLRQIGDGTLAAAQQDAAAATKPASKPRTPRDGTKQALLIEMLRSENGATIAEIVAATGWQQHTVRGAIAGALKKKLGLNITSEKADQGERIYRIAD
ncbi:hypothetical protein BAL199_09053 [alpha proteobacterium BAL199]|nr:hypothetical protein BAL199_09053 [alpha proteobacterium BAL199]